MRYWLYSLIALASLMAAGAAHADSAILDDGETITGRISRVEDGVLVFRTTLAGQMMVPVDTLQGLSSTGNFVLTMQDGRVLYGRLARENEVNILAPLQGGEALPLNLAEVKEAVPLPASDAAPPTAITRVGVGARQGLAESDSFSPALRLEYERQLAAGGEVVGSGEIAGDAEDFPRLAEMGLRVSGPGALAPEAALRLDRNTDAGLDYRAELRLGVLSRWLNDADRSLVGAAGLVAAVSAWDGRNFLDAPPGRERQATQGEVAPQLELRYSQVVFGENRIQGALTVTPSLRALGELRARSETALVMPLREDIQLRLQLRVDYESDPAVAGVDRWRGGIGAMIEYGF